MRPKKCLLYTFTVEVTEAERHRGGGGEVVVGGLNINISLFLRLILMSGKAEILKVSRCGGCVLLYENGIFTKHLRQHS